MNRSTINVPVHEQLLERILDRIDGAELRQLLDEGVQLATESAGASLGYFELRDDQHGLEAYRWSACNCDQTTARTIRRQISTGVIGYAVAESRIVNLDCAVTDQRFQELDSVRRNELHAVLCVPSRGKTLLGVLYLQGREEDGAFTSADCERAECFARVLTMAAEAIHARTDVANIPLAEDLKTLEARRVRESLREHEGNISEAARSLGITRARLYRALRKLT